MTPFLFHFICMSAVFLLAWYSKRRMARRHQQFLEDAKVFEYSDGTKVFTTVCTAAMGLMLLWAEALQEAQNPEGESFIPFAMSVFFSAGLYVVLDRRMVLTSSWVSSGLTVLDPPKVSWAEFRGSSVSSTLMFGGVTTVSTAAGRLRIWHQLDSSRAVRQRVLPLTRKS